MLRSKGFCGVRDAERLALVASAGFTNSFDVCEFESAGVGL